MSLDTGCDGALLAVRDLACTRNLEPIFSNLTFSVPNGALLSLEGPNGSGKTTLLRILCGFVEPETGEIELDGAPLTQVNRAAKIAFVGHRHGLASQENALENLNFLGAISTKPQILTAHQALERVGLDARAHIPTAKLSAGQRQRAALAGLIMFSTSLWLLDEPLTSLDRDAQGLLAELLGEHLVQGGSAIVATHQALPGDLPRERLILPGGELHS